MKYKAIIFDLDGVICHTDKYHYEAWKKIADRLDIYFDETINNLLRGVSRMESFDIILRRYDKEMSKEEKLKYTSEKNEIYKELLKNISVNDVSKEVRNTLDTLKANGLKIAIGSSSKNAKFILKQLGLEGYFDAVADGNQIKNSKPDPEVFLLAAELVGEYPKDCLVVEDAIAGVEAARAGGIDVAGISNAVSSEFCTYRLSSFVNLLDCCK